MFNSAYLYITNKILDVYSYFWARFRKRTLKVEFIKTKNGITTYSVNGEKYKFKGTFEKLQECYPNEDLEDSVYGFCSRIDSATLIPIVKSYADWNVGSAYTLNYTKQFKKLAGPLNDFHCREIYTMDIIDETFVSCDSVYLRCVDDDTIRQMTIYPTTTNYDIASKLK